MGIYQSNFQRRSRPVEARDFENPEIFRIDSSWPAANITQRTLHDWNKKIPLMPTDFYSIFSDNFGEDVRLSLDFNADFIDIGIKSKTGNKFYGNVTFDGRGKCENSSYTVDANAQGQGYGKAWLKSLVEMCVAMDYPDFGFLAADRNGGYTWAKLGAHLDMSPRTGGARDYLSKKMIGRLESIKDHISAYDYNFGKALSRGVAKDDLSRFAQIKTVVSGDVYEQLSQDDSKIFQSLKEFFTQYSLEREKPVVVAYSECSAFRKAFENASRQETAITLPRLILNNLAWYALIDFNDARQMEKIGAYVGGWSNIELTTAKKMPAHQAGTLNL